MSTHEPNNPCAKPGCQGGHVPGKCAGHASDGSGRPCGNWPIRGAVVCRRHGASAPQVKAAAQMRILENADAVAAALVKIALNEAEPAPSRVAAARDLLDRAGLGAARQLDVTHRDLGSPDARAAASLELADEVARKRAEHEAREAG